MKVAQANQSVLNTKVAESVTASKKTRGSKGKKSRATIVNLNRSADKVTLSKKSRRLSRAENTFTKKSTKAQRSPAELTQQAGKNTSNVKKTLNSAAEKTGQLNSNQQKTISNTFKPQDGEKGTVNNGVQKFASGLKQTDIGTFAGGSKNDSNIPTIGIDIKNFGQAKKIENDDKSNNFGQAKKIEGQNLGLGQVKNLNLRKKTEGKNLGQAKKIGDDDKQLKGYDKMNNADKTAGDHDLEKSSMKEIKGMLSKIAEMMNELRNNQSSQGFTSNILGSGIFAGIGVENSQKPFQSKTSARPVGIAAGAAFHIGNEVSGSELSRSIIALGPNASVSTQTSSRIKAISAYTQIQDLT